MLRDNLKTKEHYERLIDSYKKFVNKRNEKIKNIKIDIENGVQRFPKGNMDILKSTYQTKINYEMNIICAKYSLGKEISEIENDVVNIIGDLENMEADSVSYTNLLWIVSLSILLEVDSEIINKLYKIVENMGNEDLLINYFLKVNDYDINKNSKIFCKETPYSLLKDVINAAYENMTLSRELLTSYVESEWLIGHADFEWDDAHKREDYVGLWSFESAAISKIWRIDDENLKDNIHYPYELAHYKNEKKYIKLPMINDNLKCESNEVISGIKENKQLDEIIPVKFHMLINNLINDYNMLSSDKFYSKYKELISIDKLCFSYEDYANFDMNRNKLGSIIVYTLVEMGVITQIDYKEKLPDELRKAYELKKNEAMIIKFVLDDDQEYYALVPKTVNIDKIYEININKCDLE